MRAARGRFRSDPRPGSTPATGAKRGPQVHSGALQRLQCNSHWKALTRSNLGEGHCHFGSVYGDLIFHLGAASWGRKDFPGSNRVRVAWRLQQLAADAVRLALPPAAVRRVKEAAAPYLPAVVSEPRYEADEREFLAVRDRLFATRRGTSASCVPAPSECEEPARKPRCSPVAAATWTSRAGRSVRGAVLRWRPRRAAAKEGPGGMSKTPDNPTENAEATAAAAPTDFIREIVVADLASGKHPTVITRFPPEPNGYLHIGHAKSICLNFGIAAQFGGRCHLRYDDTNPTKEEQEYIDSIELDVRWLGFDWGRHLYFASDYFEQMYTWAELLVTKGKAYVCDCTADEVRERRGTLTEPGRPCAHRKRPAAASMDLFRRMRAGEFPDGARVLRARIDLASGNINMRDPVLYRILHAPHPHAGDQWCIYPMYDYAHPLEDAIERITHSICTLEFEDHRPFYDWVIDECELPEPHPQQIEFARLNLSYTVMSKRKLLQLVQDGLVSGWDDPRMPTISGLRRRGVPPAAIRDFADRIGVAKRDSVVDVQLFEHCVREELNRRAPRRMAVLRPVKLVIDNYPEGQIEEFEVANNPEDPAAGSRLVPFSRTLWIEQDDVREVPPPKYWRLFPGNEVRLRSAYLVRCTGVVKDPAGKLVEVHATYDPATRGGGAPDGRKIKSTIHWVAADHAVGAEVRLYDSLFTTPDPGDAAEGADWKANLNPASLEVLAGCMLEPALVSALPEERFQFERMGYFSVDLASAPGRLVFNRTVTLKDAWAKIEKKQG